MLLSSIKSLSLVKIHHTLGIPLLEYTIQTCDTGILFLEKTFPEQPQLECDWSEKEEEDVFW